MIFNSQEVMLMSNLSKAHDTNVPAFLTPLDIIGTGTPFNGKRKGGE